MLSQLLSKYFGITTWAPRGVGLAPQQAVLFTCNGSAAYCTGNEKAERIWQQTKIFIHDAKDLLQALESTPHA